MKKRVLTVIAVIIFMFVLLSVNVQSYIFYGKSDVKLSGAYNLCTDCYGGFYSARETNGSFEVLYINNNSAKSFSFKTDGKSIESFSGCNGRIAAIFSDRGLNLEGSTVSQLQVLTYDFNTGISDINTINSSIVGKGGFALGKDYYYTLHDTKTIKAFSIGGSFKFSVHCSKVTSQIIYDSYADRLYAVHDGGISCVSDGSAVYLGSIKTPVILSGGSMITSADGNVYFVGRNSLNCSYNVASGKGGAVINNRVYYPDGSVIYGKDSSGEVVCSFDTERSIDRVFVCGTKIAVVSAEGELLIVDTNEMKEIPKGTQPSSGNNGGNQASQGGQHNSSSAGGAVVSGGRISSSVYSVNNSDMTISNIKPGTTIAVFKSNLKFNGYKVTFKNYSGQAKISGNVGTGFRAYFSGPDSRQYTLIVPGDITGEGNINSRDIKAYMSYLCGKTKLDAPFMKAFDINGDGKNDTLDLLIAAKQ